MNAATKLGAYAVVLALAVAGGAAVGAAIGPEPDDDPPTHGVHVVDAESPESTDVTVPGDHRAHGSVSHRTSVDEPDVARGDERSHATEQDGHR